jgi:hypothetical protein
MDSAAYRSPSERDELDSRHVGLIGGLGVGAAAIYYRAIVAGCADRGAVPRITIVHADAPTTLAHVAARRIDELAGHLANFVGELRNVGAEAGRRRAPSTSRCHDRNKRSAPTNAPVDAPTAGRVQARRAPKRRRPRR